MPTPNEILKKYWGFDKFRPSQLDIIESVLGGRDTLALLPTGGGKSICFQVPALCLEGVTLVVSPLIALMKDQVQNLKQKNIAAEAIFSGLHKREVERIFDNCTFGDTKILYLSPERLANPDAIERIKQMKVAILVVDEAHCISQWGYDFRPPYLKIAAIRPFFPKIPVLALTATATKEVVQDIQQRLEFSVNNIFQKSFSRSNLSYVVFNQEHKDPKMLDILQKVKGSAVVYVKNRKKTKDISQYLLRHQISADFYHAGLEMEERSKKQDNWINNKTRVMVSTNAFGMGIDKPDVRTVIHLDLPESLEAYFQEAGRAGRDEAKAYCVLLYNLSDKIQLERNFILSFPEIDEIKNTYRALGSYLQLAIGSGIGESFDFELNEFALNFKLEVAKTYSCLKVLEQSGWIALNEAIKIPSSVTFLVDKHQLYDYQIKNEKLDLLIRTLLRLYQGIATQIMSINEFQIATICKSTKELIIKGLNLLHSDKIIDYSKQKDKPQLVFVRERVDISHLDIDVAAYNFRKNRHKWRIEKVISYAETAHCRSRQLLDYFGEENSTNCGVCDICLERKKNSVSNNEFNTYSEKIKILLEKNALNLEELVNSFAPKRKDMVLRTIEFLIDEGLIFQEKNKYAWNK